MATLKCGVFLIALSVCSMSCSANEKKIKPNLRGNRDIQDYGLKPRQTLATNPNEDSVYREDQNDCSRPTSCADIQTQGQKRSGVYTIYPRQWMNAEPFQVYCDMETDGGGWTVFQRRDDNWNYPEVNFTRRWGDYKKGFGDLRNEFWLGNDRIHILTSQDRVELRIEVEDWDDDKRYSLFTTFTVENEMNLYRGTFSGYSGTAGNGFGISTSYSFSTYDYGPCAKQTPGGWWFYSSGGTYCMDGLNGIYYRTNVTNRLDGLLYKIFKGQNYSLKRSQMKLRPTYFRTYHPD